MAKGKTTGYREISERYERLIRSGELKPGQMLLKEPLLARQHGVTRTTLRKAFASLVDKGLVIKRRGQGTFIASASDVARRVKSPIAVVSRHGYVLVHPEMNADPRHAVHGAVSSCIHQLLESVTRALSAHGRSCQLYYATENPDNTEQVCEKIGAGNVAGIVSIGAVHERLAERLVSLGLPTVFVDSVSANVKADFVSMENQQGMKEATRHLLKTTPGPVGFIGHNTGMTVSPHSDRYLGFLDAHRELGVEIDERYHFESKSVQPYEGKKTAQEILRLSPRPTGIACSDDGLALGAVEACQESGVAIPEKISVIGFANSLFCLMSIPTISSVSPDRALMGQVAVALLEKRFRTPSRAPERVDTHTHLVLRYSTLTLSGLQPPANLRLDAAR